MLESAKALEIVSTLQDITRSAFQTHMQQGVQQSSHKTANDLLTDADLKMDAYIQAQLLQHYPDAHLLTEETLPDTPLTGNTFVIDPIDGTCNYANGMALCGIQIALFQEETCVLSVIDLPYLGEFYFAILDGGAYCNGVRLQVNRDIAPSEGILQLSDFYPVHPIPLAQQFAIVQKLQSRFLKTRLFGAAVIDFTNLATGKAQAYLCYYHYIWDIAPGLLLAREAGCWDAGLEGAYQYHEKVLLVGNNPQAVRLLQSTVQEELHANR